ncbi:hypothetical protein K1719_037690 [Acacia pycnantha]|nr:hypothetical protein K1719_037690 [Acacia pycnantha]
MKRHVLGLVICLIVTVPRTTEGGAGHDESAGKHNVTEVIEQVCEKTASKEACVKTLKGDPLVIHARGNLTVNDLAISILRMASKNATAMIYELKTLIENDMLDPQVQEGLSDCRDMMADAQDQIEVALSAITANSSFDPKTCLQATTAAVDLCKASLEEGNEHVMLAKANGFSDLCVIAGDICTQLQ